MQNAKLPKLLGYLGLTPFFILAVSAWVPRYHEVSQLMLAVYAAVILTFIGAVHWGIALSSKTDDLSNNRYLFSIFPSLIAWLVISFYGKLTLPILIGCFLIYYTVERKAYLSNAPHWYLLLRRNLTVSVTILILLATLSSLYMSTWKT